MTYNLTDILKVDWLIDNKKKLNVVVGYGENYKILWVAKSILSQKPNYNKKQKIKLLQNTMVVSIATIYNWLNNDLDVRVIYKKTINNYYEDPKANKIPFTIQLVERDRTKDVVKTFETTPPVIFKRTVTKKKPKNKNILSAVEVAAERKKKIYKFRNEQKRIFENDDDKEKAIMSLCKDFATGTVTIVEACAAQNIPYLQFIEILTEDERAKQMYDEAVLINNTIQSTRQLTLVDQRIIELLVSGQYESIKITQKKQTNEKTKVSVWVDVTRTITKRNLTIAEIMTLKVALMKAHQLGATMAPDEFAGMSDKDLLDYINKNYAELN